MITQGQMGNTFSALGDLHIRPSINREGMDDQPRRKRPRRLIGISEPNPYNFSLVTMIPLEREFIDALAPIALLNAPHTRRQLEDGSNLDTIIVPIHELLEINEVAHNGLMMVIWDRVYIQCPQLWISNFADRDVMEADRPHMVILEMAIMYRISCSTLQIMWWVFEEVQMTMDANSDYVVLELADACLLGSFASPNESSDIWDSIYGQYPEMWECGLDPYYPTPVITEEHMAGSKGSSKRGKNKKTQIKRRREPEEEENEPEEEPIDSDTSIPPAPPSVHSKGLDPVETANKVQETVKAMMPSAQSEELDWFLHGIEAFLIGSAGMVKAQDNTSFTIAFLQMCHSIYGKSISFTMMELCGAVGVTDTQASGGDVPSWIAATRGMLEDWDGFKSSPLRTVGIKILGIVVSLGYCSLEGLNFELKGIQVFSDLVVPEKVTMTDLLSCALSILELCVNQGYEAYTTGSITPLLYDSEGLTEILAKVAECEQLDAYFQVGDLQSHAVDEPQFANKLAETRTELKHLAQVMKNSVSKKILMDKYSKLGLMEASLRTRMTTGGLKIAPFVVGIWGGSCVGKTTVNNITVKALLRACKASYADKDHLKMNPCEGFASGAHNGVSAITFDEISQVKEKHMPSPPPQMTFMQLANNEVTTLVMADLAQKGKVAPRPVVMTTTKNVKDNGSRDVMKEPIACARREHFIMTIQVRDQFSTNGFLDSNKLREYYGGAVCIPDAWVIRIEKVVAKPGKGITKSTNVMETDFEYELVVKDGKEWKDLSMEEALELLIEEAKEHYEFQKELVKVNTNLGDRLPFCDKHAQLYRTCGCEVPGSKATDDEDDQSEESEEEQVEDKSQSMSTLTKDSESIFRKAKSWFTTWWKKEDVKKEDLVQKELEHIFTRNIHDSVQLHLNPGKHSKFLNFVDDMVKTEEQIFNYSVRPDRSYQGIPWTAMSKFWMPGWSFIGNSMLTALRGAVEDDLNKVYARTKKQGMFNFETWIPDKVFNSDLGRSALLHYYTKPWLKFVFAWTPVVALGYYLTTTTNVHELYPKTIPREVSWFGMARMIFHDVKKPTHPIPRAVFGCVASFEWLGMSRHLHDTLLWKKIKYDRTNVPDVVQRIREDHSPKLLKAMAVLTTAAAAIKLWRWCGSPTPWAKQAPTEIQGTLIPDSIEDETKVEVAKAAAKAVAHEKGWISKMFNRKSDFSVPQKALTTTEDDLVALLSRQLYEMRWTDPDTGVQAHGLILGVRSNRGLTVGHFKLSKDTLVHFVRKNGNFSGNFKCWIGPKSIVRFGQDSAIVHIPKQQFRDITDFFSDSEYQYKYAKMLWRLKDTETTLSKVLVDDNMHEGSVLKTTCNSTGSFKVYKYSMPMVSQYGLCGSPLISDGKRRVIIGIHEAGEPKQVAPDSKLGFAVPVFRKELLQALEESAKTWFEPVSASVVPKELTGKPIVTSTQMHFKSPLRKLESGHYTFIGSHRETATFRPTVHLLPSARPYEKLTGLQCPWKAPSMPDPWFVTLQKITNCSSGIEPEHAFWAQEDYLNQYKRLEHEHPDWLAQVRVLTVEEVLNGVPGVRYLEDGLDMTTSAGFGGLKKRDLVDRHVLDTGEVRYTPKAELLESIEIMKQKWNDGERAYPVFVLCFKDEAVDKEKMRAFAVGLFAFTIVSKQYLGYIHWLHKKSLEYSECAVGLNPHGPEWEEALSWQEQNGTKFPFGADHSNFDLNQAASTKGMSFRLEMEVLKMCPNYDQKEGLPIVRGICTEKMYPLIIANGDVLIVYGFSPSGVTGTVEENSLDNGHILRSAAHAICPQYPGKFRDVIRCITYGDDVTGFVHPLQTWYNLPAVSAACARWGLVVTDAAKSKVITNPWNHDGEFLKMTTGHVEGTDIRVGKLRWKSIRKPIYVGTQTTLTPKAAAACNLDNSIRDAFAHGRKEYEEHRILVRKIAEELDILDWVPEAAVDYDSARVRWAQRYGVELKR